MLDPPRKLEKKMQTLIQEIASSVCREGVFMGVSRVLVGCSGGCDSTALLDILVRLAPQFEVNIAVAHLHHGWRGTEADADLDCARQLAENYEVPFFASRVDLSAARGSREEVARSARLDFFESIVADWNADVVALGHTADDQLETVLLNLVRGTGRRGLGGMRPRSEVGDLILVRPLLGRRRHELREYALSRSLEWNEDSSNEDVSLSRNRLRLRLLSELEQVHPSAVKNVSRATELLREEEEWLDVIAADAFEEVVDVNEHLDGVSLRKAELGSMPRPLQRRVVRNAIALIRGDCRGISYEHVEWVIDINHSEKISAHDLPGVRVKREGDHIRLLPLDGRRLARS